MKTIAVTPRVYESEHGERSEALAQTWSHWLENEGYRQLTLTFHMPALEAQLESFSPDAVILSGGNSTPQREAAETHIINWAMQHNRPLFGVCRGMQFLNEYFGGRLVQLEGHAGTCHNIIYEESMDSEEVNSYHDWSIAPDGLSAELQTVAKDEAGYVEAMRHKTLPIAATMWHPEREAVGHPSSRFIKEFLKRYL